MAELVDALDSKSGFRKEVQVRFLFWAHTKADSYESVFFVLILWQNKNWCNWVVVGTFPKFRTLEKL
jgi:hypothetical protein